MRLSERRALLVAATMVALFSGCTVGPNYKTPESVPPPTYSATPATQPAAESLAWWTTFNDPTLNQVIEMARNTNLDLKAAEARVREARATRGTVTADYYPTVDGKAQ